MRLGLSGGDARGDRELFEALKKPFVDASLGAMRDVTDEAVKGGRASIAAAGFSSRWQQGLQGKVFPNSGVDPAGFVFHKIGYAGVFQEGAQIAGKPLLWLPTSEAPQGERGRAMSARQYARRVGPLVSVNRPGKPPMLFPKERKGQRNRVARPLYIGIPTVNIRKRFDVVSAIEKAADRFGEFFDKHLKDD